MATLGHVHEWNKVIVTPPKRWACVVPGCSETKLVEAPEAAPKPEAPEPAPAPPAPAKAEEKPASWPKARPRPGTIG